MGDPHVSERRYIRWLPDQPSEPTSTIVLTSAQSRFVDLRILKDSPPDVLAQIDWAFAGTSASQPAHEERGRIIPAHSTWTHWVDSRVSYEEEPPTDEGDMYPQPNGDVLEKGRMAHPETGIVTEYEELWTDIEVRRTGQDTTRVSVVLMADDSARRARGMIVRIGQWCQGILKIGNDLSVERWEYCEGSPGDQTGWQRLVKIGELEMPCPSTFTPADLALHGANTVSADGVRWTLVEKFEW